MDFNIKPPEWGNEGTEPLTEEKAQGFAAEDVLPAPYLNWQWHRTYECLKELQNILKNAVFPIEQGGTGAKTASGAVKNLLGKELISADNLKSADKLVDSGFYRCYFDSADIPPEDYNFPSKYGVMLVVASSSYISQLFFDVLNSVYYFRASSNSGSTWKNWKRVLSENETGTKGQVMGFKDNNVLGAMTLAAVDIGAMPNKNSVFTGNIDELTDGVWKIAESAKNTPASGIASVLVHKTWNDNFAIQLCFPSQNKMYRRTKSHGTWYEWQMVYDEATLPAPKDFMFQERIEDSNVVNANSLIEIGTYLVYLESSSLTEYNYPYQYGILTTEGYSSYLKQTFYDMVGRTNWVRSTVNKGTTWTDWHKQSRIQTGSYVGTGEHGASNKNTLVFDEVDPRMVIVRRAGYLDFCVFSYPFEDSVVFIYDNTRASGAEYEKVDSSYASKTLSWYNDSSDAKQLNKDGTTYHYTVLY